MFDEVRRSYTFADYKKRLAELTEEYKGDIVGLEFIAMDRPCLYYIPEAMTLGDEQYKEDTCILDKKPCFSGILYYAWFLYECPTRHMRIGDRELNKLRENIDDEVIDELCQKKGVKLDYGKNNPQA